ncbi:MAG TPA: DUF2795 domain-containing protein [Stellaceae bacterium]|jgi:hypothetical protein
MTRGLGGHAPANISYHLKGAHFPASKRELIDLAKKNGADRDVLEVLQDLPGERFLSVADVMKAYGEADRS